jgi:hypothetical protein
MMERSDINWNAVVELCTKSLVKTLVGLSKGKPMVPLPLPLAEFTLICCESIEVKLPGMWIYSLRDEVLRHHLAQQSTLVDAAKLVILDLSESLAQSLKITRCLWSAYWTHWSRLRIEKKPVTKEFLLAQLSASLMFYLPMSGKEQEFIPFLKYQLSWLFARGFDQSELPVRPDWIWHSDGLLLAGSLGKIFKRQTFGRKLANWEFRNTVLHGIKKGLPQMGEYHLAQNLYKHAKRLGEARFTSEEALAQIERTAREIFPHKILMSEWSKIDEYTSLSSNASFESTRLTDGPLGVAWRVNQSGLGDEGLLCLMDSMRKSPYTPFLRSVSFEERTLSRMIYFPRMNRCVAIMLPANLFVYEELGSLRSISLNLLSDDSHSLTCIHPEDVVSKTPPKGVSEEAFLEYYRSQILPNQRKIPVPGTEDFRKNLGCASVKAIFEPLKVRLITAGDIWSNGLWGGLQKLLWRRLQKFPQFILTGKSVESQDVQNVLKKSWPGFNKWVSGDYSAATDNMHMDVTHAMIGSIAGDVETYEVLRRGLTSNVVSYGAIELEEQEVPEPFVMKRGQLMGCVFSFILLCVANIAMYRWSLEERDVQDFGVRNNIRIEDLPVLVNGDDILFKADTDLIKIWEKKIAEVGFEKSVGKNYVSQDFCVINSCLFDVRDEDRLPNKIPYFNMGWVTGVSKGGGTKKKNKEMVDLNVKDVRRIRTQVAMTESDFLDNLVSIRSADDPPCYNRALSRRLDMVQRFKEEIFFHNKEEIFKYHLPLDKLPGGLGLSERICTDSYTNGFRKYLSKKDKSAFEQRRIIDDREIVASDVCPRALGPWKLAMLHAKRPELEELGDDYRSVTKNLKKKTDPVRDCLRGLVKTARENLFKELRDWDTLSSIEKVIFDGLKPTNIGFLVEVVA